MGKSKSAACSNRTRLEGQKNNQRIDYITLRGVLSIGFIFTAKWSEDHKLFYFTAPPEFTSEIREMGGKWNPYQRAWQIGTQGIDLIKSIKDIRYNDETRAMLYPHGQELFTDSIDADVKPVEPMPIKGLTPMSHQITAYNRGLELFSKSGGGGFALLHDPGCGKTLTAIALAGRLYLDKRIKRVLVVCPVSVMPVWEPELMNFSSVQVTVSTLRGTLTQKQETLTQNEPGGLWVAVINYESAWRLEKELLAWKPDMIICDESQRAKNHQAKQSKALHNIAKKCEFKLIMTGTPINNSPLDIWSQYRIIRPDLFSNSFYAFRNRYAVTGGYEGKQVVGFKKVEELAKITHSVAHRVSKAEALDLPEYTDQRLYCALEPAAKRAYENMKREAVVLLDQQDKIVTAPMIVTQLLRLSQMTGGFIRADDDDEVTPISRAKFNLLRETLEDMHKNKVVIFARFVAEIKEIINIAEGVYGEGTVNAIWGDTDQKARGELVEQFQNNPDIHVFVAQIRTAGLGITLHAADTCIYYSYDYSYDTYEQSKARIHRTGQRNACTAIHLIVEGSIDEAVLDALYGKRSIANDIVDNWREIMGEKGKSDVIRKHKSLSRGTSRKKSS